MAAKKTTFGNRASLNKVAKLMELADTAAGTSTPAQRQAAAGDLPAGLADMFVKIKPAERVFLAKLLKQLDEELLYDKYNPKLYYL